MTHHQRRQPDLLNDIGHREGFAGAGHSQEDIVLFALSNPLQQTGDRRRLVPRRFVGGFNLEIHGVSGSCRIRTYNLLVKSQQLYH